jgi:hypothetical protein
MALRNPYEPRGTPFDRALELRELRRAAEAYASRHGEVGSVEHRAAWLKFRHHIQSIHELRRLRRKPAPAKPRRAADRPSLPRSAAGPR